MVLHPKIKGFVSTKALMGLAGAGALSLLWWVSGTEDSLDTEIQPLFDVVTTSDFVLEFIEPGEIESAENVEIKSEVRSRSSAGTSILEIVPEGTVVKKGDFLVRLDDASLQKDLLRQRISVHQSKATLVKATADVEAAKLALQEYLSGSFRENEEQLESSEFVSKENLRRAQEYLVYSKKLAAKGYVSEAQLEADQFAVEKARKELDLAQTKLEVLRTHSRKAKVNDLNASILTAEARLQSAQNSYELEKTQEVEIEEQIVKCMVLSPAAGEVTYANNTKSGASDVILIEEGKQVRENQTIIRLPNVSLLRVRAKVNENRIEKVRPGMKCTILIDAMRDLQLNGKVESVSEYPLPSVSRYTSHIKEYATEIVINNPPSGVRTGMTAKVTIKSEFVENTLQVPLTAIFRKEGKTFCITGDENGDMEIREIKLGSYNMNMAVVLGGLKVGERIVLNPDYFRPSLELTESQSLILN
ncbi:MAG: HlyD family efflux transporter periplasmic adaptor subunit [Opitutae bacterium]|jgi:multidrug efflux pump subunit AcrA (membrane-fusion protein)|nr:HlyD family efflux transporter periplasmic adaptor subunit [Opitutae bacterium]